ncbi:MAG: hybrid sensor histidine kinase/response regulator [Myxococcota bacterium]|nr:hybrid sensor histidine kinase/response regulator [Myxococcota bacterium]
MSSTDDELRVLVWTPRGRDSSLAAHLLERNGLAAVACSNACDVAAAVASAGCVVLTEEALLPEPRQTLVEAFAKQPAWSDFPVVMFAPRGSGGVSDAISAARVFGNVTVLERPVQSRTLISAVVAALRGRRRQYEARAAIRRRDEFLAMLGHELRNPLAAMVLAVEALHRDCAGTGVRPREILDRQAHHLARLVDDLLDVTRVTTGKLTLQRRRLDLDAVLARCVQQAELIAQPRGTVLELSTSARHPVVDGDADRLEEIFSNLISNAIKYSPERSRIEITSRIADQRCIVEVADQGIGIAPDMLPRVFDLFAQADASLARSQGGLGIGLTVVKSLVELHGGAVTARSDGVGTGSCFRVDLPLGDGVSVPVAAVAEERAIRPGMRVLIVEDNADLLEMVSELLIDLGCEVITAIDGPSGLEQLLHDGFELALVDLGLPGLDGYEVVRRARAASIHVPRLVALTGYGQAEDRERALAAGFDDHLTKPISLATLQHLVASTRALSSTAGELERVAPGHDAGRRPGGW